MRGGRVVTGRLDRAIAYNGGYHGPYRPITYPPGRSAEARYAKDFNCPIRQSFSRPRGGSWDRRRVGNLELARGEHAAPWRKHTLYEYYWEQNYPQTPTMHALVGDRYKYIRYHGLWDTNELYDFASDPEETANLIHQSDHRARAEQLNSDLFDVLRETGGTTVPLARDRGFRFPWRHPARAKQGQFPSWMFKEKEPPREPKE